MAEQEKPTAEATNQTPSSEQPPQAMTVDVPQAILFCINLLSELAWQKMGLHINPVTKQLETDFPQARLAIDAVGQLVELLRNHVGEREYNELRTLLANLQLNFAHQVQSQQSGQEQKP